MPARIRFDIMVVDRSPLAHNLYQLLFAGQNRFRLYFADEFHSLNKRSPRFRPDVLLVNSNTIPKDSLGNYCFPCPTILVVSKWRVDLKEVVGGQENVTVIQKPFYPYDLLSMANRLTARKLVKAKRRGKSGKTGKKARS